MTLVCHVRWRYQDVEVEEGRGQAQNSLWGRGKFEGFFEGCKTFMNTVAMGI